MMKTGKKGILLSQPYYVATRHASGLEPLCLRKVAKTLACSCAWHVVLLVLHSRFQEDSLLFASRQYLSLCLSIDFQYALHITGLQPRKVFWHTMVLCK